MKNILLHPALPKIRRVLYRFLGIFNGFLSEEKGAVIFCYHGVGNDTWRFGVAFDEFVRQMESLEARGYRPVTLSDIYRSMKGEGALPEKAFALTFDDGYRDTLLVKNFLLKKGISPTLFVLSDAEHVKQGEIETNRAFLSTSEILELQAAGWEIGCHSATHADFSALSPKERQQEIVDSKQELEKKLGRSLRFFAYPKGYHDETIQTAVQRAGYDAAFSMDDGFIGEGTDRFAIPRIGIDRTHTLEEFNLVALPSSILFRRSVKGLIALLDALRKMFRSKTRLLLSEQH